MCSCHAAPVHLLAPITSREFEDFWPEIGNESADTQFSATTITMIMPFGMSTPLQLADERYNTATEVFGTDINHMMPLDVNPRSSVHASVYCSNAPVSTTYLQSTPSATETMAWPGDVSDLTLDNWSEGEDTIVRRVASAESTSSKRRHDATMTCARVASAGAVSPRRGKWRVVMLVLEGILYLSRFGAVFKKKKPRQVQCFYLEITVECFRQLQMTPEQHHP